MRFVSTLFDSLGALAPAPTHSKLPLTFEALNQVCQQIPTDPVPELWAGGLLHHPALPPLPRPRPAEGPRPQGSWLRLPGLQVRWTPGDGGYQ